VGIVCGNEDVVVVVGGDDVAADSLGGELGADAAVSPTPSRALWTRSVMSLMG
jgi:hypothetical protein